jgi:hypothetical protein
MKRVAYRLGWFSVMLWMLHAVFSLWESFQWMNGTPASHWSGLLLESAAACGLLAGAVYAASSGVHRSVSRVCALAGFIGVISLLLPLIQTPFAGPVARAARLYLGYPLAAAALGFWLGRVFSRLPEIWFQIGIKVVTGVILVSGVLLTLVASYPFLPIEGLGGLIVVIVPLCYLIYARHGYAPLGNRSDSPALAAHWAALCLLLLLLMALAGTVTGVPGIRQWTLGTRLDALQESLGLYAALAMGLGCLNQMALELRGILRRVTGLMPFWLMSFGVFGLCLTLLIAGTAQVYLEGLAGLPTSTTIPLIAPPGLGVVIGSGLMLTGAVIYALQLWVRRPGTRT